MCHCLQIRSQPCAMGRDNRLRESIWWTPNRRGGNQLVKKFFGRASRRTLYFTVDLPPSGNWVRFRFCEDARRVREFGDSRIQGLLLVEVQG